MSLDTQEWLGVGHIIGFVVWIGGLITVLQLLRVHGAVEGAARDVLARQERKAAVLMDIGATLTLVCGLWRALGMTPNKFTTGAWLHIKVTVVVLVILGIHGWARVQVRKFRKGKVRPIPAGLPYVVLLAVVTAIVLGGKKDLLRKHADAPSPPAVTTPGK